MYSGPSKMWNLALSRRSRASTVSAMYKKAWIRCFDCFANLSKPIALLPFLFSLPSLSSLLKLHRHVLYSVVPFAWKNNREAQGRSQTSEQDEASFERQRCEPLGGSGGMPPSPQKILKTRGSEMLLLAFCVAFFCKKKKKKCQNQDEATASSCLMLVTAPSGVILRENELVCLSSKALHKNNSRDIILLEKSEHIYSRVMKV